MVFNSSIIVSLAHKSAEVWQEIGSIHLQDRVSSHQLLDIVCCFPLQQLGNFALWIWNFLCLPQPDSSFYPYYAPSSSDDDDEDRDFDHPPPHLRYALGSSSSSSSSVDLDGYYHDSHSD